MLHPRCLPAAAALGVGCFSGREGLQGSPASARHNTDGSAADSTDYPGREGRARGGSHAPPQRARPRGRQRRVRAGDAEPARGLTPRTGPEPERGRLSRGISESISVPGRGARTAAVPERLEWKREPPLSSRTQEQPPPVPPVPSTPQSGGGCRSAGEEAHLSAAAAEAEGSTEEGSSDPPRRLSAGAGGTQRRGPDGRFPELLLRSSVLTAVPGNQRPNCHSPPPSAPAVSASSSHSFLPPPAHPAPPRRAARVPCVMASRPPGPPRAALGGCRSLAHVRPGSSWRVLLATGCRGGPRSARPLCGPVSRPFCPSAGSTLPRAGGAVGQVSPPRMGGVAGAAPEVVVDAGLEDPGFWHSARHLLLVSLCSHGSPVRLAAPGRARLGCCCEFLLLSAWKCLPESGGAPAASFLTVLEDLILPQGLLAAALSRNLTPYVRVQRIFATRLFPSPTSLNFTKSLKYSKFILQYLLIHSELL